MTGRIDTNDLLRQFVRDRSDAAFRGLVRHYLPLVYNAALRQVGNEHLAEDVAQAVFILLWRKARTFDDASYLPGWLYKTTRYACSNALRTENRRRRFEKEAARMTSTQTLTEVDWNQLSPEIDRALSRLSSGDRELVLLRYFENLETPELSVRLAISEPAARKRLSRAMDRLRANLSEQGFTASSLSIAGLISRHFAPPVPEHLTETVATGSLSGAGKAAALAAATASTLFMAKASFVASVAAGILVVVFSVALLIYWNTQHPSLAAKPAAATQPDWAIAAANAFAQTRSVHAMVAETVQSAHERVDIFVQQNPSRAVVVYERPKSRTIQIAEGSNEWNYSETGNVVARRPQTQDAISQLDIGDTICWWKLQNIQRDPSKDKPENVPPLQAYVSTRRRGTNTIWVDSAMLARDMEASYPPYTSHTHFEWNTDLPADRFTPQPPAGTRIVDPVQYIEELYPLNSAVWKHQFNDTIAAIHRVERGEDGLIYLISSTRLAPEARTAAASQNYNQHSPLHRHVVPMNDGEGGPWRSCPMNRLQVCDVVVFYCVLLPQREGLSNARLEMTAINDERGSKDRARFMLDVPDPEVHQTLMGFAAEAYAATDRFTSILAPCGGLFSHPNNGVDWTPIWATDAKETGEELAQTIERWADGYWMHTKSSN